MIGYLRSQCRLDDVDLRWTFFTYARDCLNHLNIMNTEGIDIGKTFFAESQIYQVGIREILSISLGGSLMRRRSSRVTRFIRNRTGIHRIPPLRSLSHVKRRGLRGSETAAKGANVDAHSGVNFIYKRR